MICSTSSFNKLLAAAMAVLLLAGCLRSAALLAPGGEPLLVAVLPLENLSASSAPLAQLQAAYAEQLQRQGIAVLADATLTTFMARQRLRHTGSLDAETATAFRQELGVTAVVITTLELYQDGEPPKIALLSRLVRTGSEPLVAWMDGVSFAGDAAPGLLELGLIHEMEPLRDQAMATLAQSLARSLAGGAGKQSAAGIAPAVYFRSPALDADRRRVAVLPFVNQSERRYAGELLLLHCVRQMVEEGNFEVVEPGVVRSALMQNRVIIPEGASLDISTLLFDKLDADLLLSGQVMTYEDYRGPDGAPAVSFSVQGVTRERGETAWASQSHRSGDEGSFFFAWGKVRTAHELATRMTRKIAKLLAGAKPEQVQDPKPINRDRGDEWAIGTMSKSPSVGS